MEKEKIGQKLKVKQDVNWRKCVICGKFIKYEDMQTERTGCEFTPETDRTHEKIEYWHKKCEK